MGAMAKTRKPPRRARRKRSSILQAASIALPILVGDVSHVPGDGSHHSPHTHEEPPSPSSTRERKPRGKQRPPDGESEAEVLATMARFGRAAVRAEREDEAEAFVGALAPMAAALAPAAAEQWAAATPSMVRGLSRAAAHLRRDPVTRPLIAVLPAATARAARHAQARTLRGGTVTPSQLVSQLGRETERLTASLR
jgi:hypothetical protein